MKKALIALTLALCSNAFAVEPAPDTVILDVNDKQTVQITTKPRPKGGIIW